VRIRFRFSKLGKVRWTSHRDVARMWERALRRTQLPIAVTAGFTPRPKVSFGLALPTGHESVAEYLDVELDCESLDVAGLPARLSAAGRGRCHRRRADLRVGGVAAAGGLVLHLGD
jgi:radical SAM-linked protein